MPRRAKPFIDKKKSVTFQLVHRSQKDPLAADDDAPQRVLLPYGGVSKIPDSISEVGYDYEVRLSTQKKFGIGFEDDYDYMQHLREPTEKQTAVLVPTNKRVVVEVGDENEDGMTDILKNDKPILQLPSVVFGSKVEEDIGLLHRAIPPVGPQPSWDPDVVAGLEEDFDHCNPENQLEDNFMELACKEDLAHPQNDDMEHGSDMGSDFDDWEFSDDEHEETKSQFTSYSMTSSVMRRNDQLTFLDDKFERFFESYEDSKIGDLPQVEIEGGFPVDDVNNVEGMKMLLGLKDARPDEDIEAEKLTPNQILACCDVSGSDSDDSDMVTMVKDDVREKWDCETILSTYSSLFNHPKLIQEPTKKVKVSDRTGIPLNDAPRLTKKELRSLDPQEPLPKPTPPARRKDESKEEKSQRKKAVKEARTERRLEKKATKVAFKNEHARQKKELLNLRQNLSGIKIS